MLKTHLLLPLLLCQALLGCSDKEESVPQPSTPNQLLSSQKWQVRSIILSSSNQPTVDLYALVRSCSRDDYVEFSKPNTYQVDEGVAKCSPADPQTRLGVWSLDSNDTQLTVALNGFTTIYRVEELTLTSLKITTTRVQSNGVPATQTNIYEAL